MVPSPAMALGHIPTTCPNFPTWASRTSHTCRSRGLMRHMDRRRLFKLTGVGSVLIAGAALPVVGKMVSEQSQSDAYNFRASVGLPEQPLPSYATYLVEGTIDLVKGTGRRTSRVLAGHPADQIEVGLPGLGRIIRVTAVNQIGSQLNVTGMIQARSQLQPGESSQVELLIDRRRGGIQAPFLGSTFT